MKKTDILICGAGPAGLGAAWRLTEQSRSQECSIDWMLVDAGSNPGGMATSTDTDGFTWDLGGHVLFPHYAYFDEVLDKVVKDWVEVKPVRGAWMHDKFIPYPVQRNIRHFPKPVLEQCLGGLAFVSNSNNQNFNAENFEQHLQQSFGQGLYKHFFKPLNLKMWGTDPKVMTAGWTQHRSGSKSSNVPTVDLQRIIDNIENQRDDVAWSEDTRIRYPAFGGTGAIWQGVARQLPEENLQFNQSIVSINMSERVATLADGNTVAYNHLFTSMPIDKLLNCISDQPDLAHYAGRFEPARVDVVGVGIRGMCPDELKDLCSIYLPDESISFWRATVLSNYSSSMSPEGTWSILCEINSGPARVPEKNPVESVIEDLIRLGFISRDNVVTSWHRHLEYGYPVPTLERDSTLAEIQPILESNGIYSRGRFGGWKYEVCNQDHAFMQGVEVVDLLTVGAEEITYQITAPRQPEIATVNVNSAVNTQLHSNTNAA